MKKNNKKKIDLRTEKAKIRQKPIFKVMVDNGGKSIEKQQWKVVKNNEKRNLGQYRKNTKKK